MISVSMMSRNGPASMRIEGDALTIARTLAGLAAGAVPDLTTAEIVLGGRIVHSVVRCRGCQLPVVIDGPQIWAWCTACCDAARASRRRLELVHIEDDEDAALEAHREMRGAAVESREIAEERSLALAGRRR